MSWSFRYLGVCSVITENLRFVKLRSSKKQGKGPIKIELENKFQIKLPLNYVPTNTDVEDLISSPSKCGYILKQGLYRGKQVTERPSGLVSIQCNWWLCKRKFGYTKIHQGLFTQRKDLQAKERGLRWNHLCQHLNLGLLSRLWDNKFPLLMPSNLWCLMIPALTN